jgi:chorismate mutase
VTVWALRGAISLEDDTAEQLDVQVRRLLGEMLERNGVGHDDIISIWFTATSDITSGFPAAAARTMGLGDVPLLCGRELDVVGGMPQVVRVLMHVHTEKPRAELRHVYLDRARSLRDDLPE